MFRQPSRAPRGLSASNESLRPLEKVSAAFSKMLGPLIHDH
jgi:hypothetical protein